MNHLIWKIQSFSELSTSEIYAILALRQEVFVVEQECYYQDADATDYKALHLWAENEGEIVAYCRIFPQGIKYKECSIGRVLTSQNKRSLGLGKKMMQLALESISSRFHTHTVRISAQDYLIPFYENFGFVSTSKHYLEDHIPHTEMLRN